MIVASGQRAARTTVLLPGPHPRSMIVRGDGIMMRSARSRAGRLRSSANWRYCVGFQVVISIPVFRLLGPGRIWVVPVQQLEGRFRKRTAGWIGRAAVMPGAYNHVQGFGHARVLRMGFGPVDRCRS